MIELIDFSNCKLSSRNLEYGGRVGEKKGIIFNENISRSQDASFSLNRR